MKTRLLLTLAVSLALALPARAAPPRDEALRLAPDDFALIAVVQNLRDHTTRVSESPFAAWFPTSALGRQLLAGANVKQITDAATPVFATLGLTPTELLHDVIGDAVVFAFTPSPDGDPNGERSVIIVRPRKPDVLQNVLERLNKLQTESKELKAVVEHKHAGVSYFERQKPDGGTSEFYCFRGGVFVFSAAEADVKAAIDRDRTAPTDKPPVLTARMTKLGVADAAAVVLVNPRPLDAELAAKVKAAKPDEKAFLTRFAEVWRAVEVGAVYLNLSATLEVGVSVQFDAAKVPADARSWLIGARTPSALWSVIPDDAIAAVAGRVTANDVFDFLTALNPPDKPGVRETVEQALGPLVGRDKLPLVLDALGPDWGVWAVPPAKGAAGTLPVVVGAVKVRAVGKDVDAAKSLQQSLEYGMQVARIAYNAKHKDQIDLREERDGAAVIKYLAGDGLPVGFRPGFAMKDGYLVVSTSPDAIKSFRSPAAEPKPGEAPFARFNGTAARDYLTAHGAAVAKLLAATGVGDEKNLAQQLDGLAQVLEPVERVELLARGEATGVKLSLRITPTKPLKK